MPRSIVETLAILLPQASSMVLGHSFPKTSHAQTNTGCTHIDILS